MAGQDGPDHIVSTAQGTEHRPVNRLVAEQMDERRLLTLPRAVQARSRLEVVA